MSRNSGDNPKSRENRRGGNSKYGAKKSKYLSDKPKGKEKTGTTSAGLPKRQRTRQGEPLPKFDDKIRLNKYIAKDRKSTRLNSSHVRISYAVFCLKKKKKKK